MNWFNKTQFIKHKPPLFPVEKKSTDKLIEDKFN